MKNLKICTLHFYLLLIPLISCAQNPAEIPPAEAPNREKEGYQLIFADEFDGKNVDWNVWEAEKPTVVKRQTSRGPEAVSVVDGELRLHVKKVNRGNIQWLACYLFLKEPLENNTYVECRFKSGAPTGVNNAFWMACRTPPNDTYRNKYEIDVVEARRHSNGTGKAHLAWHDWKTYSYTSNEEGAKMDIAQGLSIDHDFEQYHVWGLWYGENEMKFYLDGEQIWDAKTHSKYTDQYHTGVGKASVWNPQEEKRAYGNHGQEDWSYYGGYNGDKIHVILSNLPWEESWTPIVESEVDGSYMAVDYVRIYKPLSLLDPQTDVSCGVTTEKIEFPKSYRLDSDANHYFSVEVDRKPQEELEMSFLDAAGKTVAKVIVDAEGYLLSGLTKLASNQFAYAPVQGMQLVKEGEKNLLVCRFTAKADKGKYDRDAISALCLKAAEANQASEPYFYPNVDENGNTSLSQGWHINQKGYSDEVITAVKFASTRGDLSSLGKFRAGKNFQCVTQ